MHRSLCFQVVGFQRRTFWAFRAFHRCLLITKVGGIGGGFACTFIIGWVTLYDGRRESGNDNCVNNDDDAGKEVEDGEDDGVSSDVAELDPEPQFWLVSGNGYSNRVLSIAKGVPTI